MTDVELVHELANASIDQRDARIARLEADLLECLEYFLECLEYFKDKYDVNDGDYGEPEPNEEMRLGTMIQCTLYGRQLSSQQRADELLAEYQTQRETAE